MVRDQSIVLIENKFLSAKATQENADNLKNQSFATAGHSGPFIHLFIFLYGVNTGINNYVVILVFFFVTIKKKIEFV